MAGYSYQRQDTTNFYQSIPKKSWIGILQFRSLFKSITHYNIFIFILQVGNLFV